MVINTKTKMLSVKINIIIDIIYKIILIIFIGDFIDLIKNNRAPVV